MKGGCENLFNEAILIIWRTIPSQKKLEFTPNYIVVGDEGGISEICTICTLLMLVGHPSIKILSHHKDITLAAYFQDIFKIFEYQWPSG